MALPLPSPAIPASPVETVRRFNRFYTRRAGLLNASILQSAYSLAEARVLWEVANSPEGVSASWLRHELGMDLGYVSRVLGAFGKRGYMRSQQDLRDRRIRLHRLTPHGRTAINLLELHSNAHVKGLLEALGEGEQHRLVDAMAAVEQVLGGKPKDPWNYVIRGPRPGDHGWVIERHGALYAREFGFDASFEAMVARVVADFLAGYDPRLEHAWLAERDGERIGCVYLVRRSQAVAQLRLLLVDPSARGVKVGRNLVAACVAFARDAGYRKVVLWTYGVLHAAQHRYREAGFVMVRQQAQRAYGRMLKAQLWELRL
jgi:DNA-binding MarR family transcriptional regulator/N-acetylglutamate synthase-like GNAT family acetyltransferase